jgi:hypothetical protein
MPVYIPRFHDFCPLLPVHADLLSPANPCLSLLHSYRKKTNLPSTPRPSRLQLSDLTVGPVLTVTNETFQAHLDACLAIPGAKVIIYMFVFNSSMKSLNLHIHRTPTPTCRSVGRLSIPTLKLTLNPNSDPQPDRRQQLDLDPN